MKEPTGDGVARYLSRRLQENDVRFISYVPDNVLTPLIKGVTSDNYFIPVNATRQDEAMGMVAGAWMGGMKGCVVM
jgi:sulfopyruvate decarboxylase TPP-binding subunit